MRFEMGHNRLTRRNWFGHFKLAVCLIALAGHLLVCITAGGLQQLEQLGLVPGGGNGVILLCNSLPMS